MRLFWITILLGLCPSLFGQQQSTDCLWNLETYTSGVPGFTSNDEHFAFGAIGWPDWSRLDDMTSAEMAEALDNLCCYDVEHFQIDITCPPGADPTLVDGDDEDVGDFIPTGYIESGSPPMLVAVHWQLVLDTEALIAELGLECDSGPLIYDIEAWVWNQEAGRYVEQVVASVWISCDGDCTPLPNDNPFGDDSDFQPLAP